MRRYFALILVLPSLGFAAEGSPDAGDLRAMTLNNLGSVEYAAGRYAAAEAYFTEARMAENQAEHVDPAQVTTIEVNLAATWYAESRLNEAAGLYREVIETATAAFGPSSPSLAGALTGLSRVVRDQGAYHEAEELSRRALSLGETVSALDTLALALRAQSKLDEAKQTAERAVTLSAPESVELADELVTSGLIRRSTGDLPAAVGNYRRAMGLYDRRFGSDSEKSTVAEQDLGLALLDSGDRAEAGRLLEHALVTTRKIYGPDHPRVALALSNRAAFDTARKDYRRAEGLYQQALEIDTAHAGPVSQRTAEDLVNIGVMQFRRHRDGESEESLGRAVDIYRHTELAPSAFCAALGNLGAVYEHERKHDRAGTTYREAVDIGKRAWGPNDPRLQSLYLGYSDAMRALGQYSEAEAATTAAMGIYAREKLRRNRPSANSDRG